MRLVWPVLLFPSRGEYEHKDAQPHHNATGFCERICLPRAATASCTKQASVSTVVSVNISGECLFNKVVVELIEWGEVVHGWFVGGND